MTATLASRAAKAVAKNPSSSALRLKTQAAVRRAGLGQTAAGTVSRAVEQARAAAMPQTPIPQPLPLAQPVAPLPVVKPIPRIGPAHGTNPLYDSIVNKSATYPPLPLQPGAAKQAITGLINGLFITAEGMFIK